MSYTTARKNTAENGVAARTPAVLDAPRLDAAIVAEIRDVVRAVVREEIAAALAPRPDHDEAADAAFLAAVARRVEGRVFTTRTLLAHARLHPDLAEALRAVGIDMAWMEDPDRPIPTGALGMVFRRLSGRPCGGYQLQREGRVDDGALWTVLYVDDRHTDAGPLDRRV